MLKAFRTLLQRGDDAEYDIDRGIDNYITAIYLILLAYLRGQRTREQAKKDIEGEAAAAFVVAFYAGFGGEKPPAEDRAWVIKRYAQELVYIENLFIGLDKRKALGLEELAYVALALSHAGNYSKSMMGVYNQGKLRGSLDTMLTLDGPDGQESCVDCQALKRQTHPASWWIENELIPGPGTGYNYECGGFNCEHRLFDSQGRQFTL